MIDTLVIQMYKMGTGDCFVLKFLEKSKTAWQMLIDCGCWTRSADEIRPYVAKLVEEVGGAVDALVVTHEHKDHVLGFQASKELFKKLKIGEIWMAWTEEDEDSEVKRWKEKYGQRKMALAESARRLKAAVDSDSFAGQLREMRGGDGLLGMRKTFAGGLGDLAELHLDGGVAASLAGMTVVKEDLKAQKRRYFKPGQILRDIPGVKTYVLGPPLLYQQVSKEAGSGGAAYRHNKELGDSDLLLSAIGSGDGVLPERPFKSGYEIPIDQRKLGPDWRRIDSDWLFGAGQFALRMNSLTNNLSLVLAFEFEQQGKVVLFPGDAEFGSWESWHQIKKWDEADVSVKDLLSKVVFYKVAHHLSHNGTARGIGLDLMTHPELVAMATLDYNVISNGWKTTMPNRLIVKNLLEKTKGRLFVTNPNGLFYDLHGKVPLAGKIEEYRGRMSTAERKSFAKASERSNDLFLEYRLKL
ncbi:MAG: MBL fold metallo-hydrolase [Candidatus Eremiobacteraeota bacterium]|nr:MBL fold metallo-hydrolase [Candidatus Eremiobacteraeota bacterium]MCW5871240.1 MBL fold metallo-hydrolase [Candidatus Eremiobacteraeota bacterium]